MDISEILKLGIMDPELLEVLKASEPPRLVYNIPTLRGVYEKVEQGILANHKPDDRIEETQLSIPVRNGVKIPARLLRPANTSLEGPLISVYHAGGFVMGSSAGVVPLCRNLVKTFNAVCVCIDYRLAPEHPFPTAVNDSWDSLQWIAANAESLGANPAKGFIIGGESSGGNITAVLSHLARDNDLTPPLTGQFLSVPSFLPEAVVPEKYRARYLSWEQNKDSPLSNRKSVSMFREAYAGDVQSPLYVPFNHLAGHAGLPPAYFQICGMDPVRDEGLIYESVLRKEFGAKTRMDVYPGVPHGFWNYFPQLKITKKAKEDIIEGIAWLLSCLVR